ncbi:MAG: hypothetical protein QXG44_13530 [Candidatus Jordarchaeaceae archaeon]
MKGKYPLLSFLVPLLVRAVPEVVSFPWPIGYDTVKYYAPVFGASQIYGIAVGLSFLVGGQAAFLYILLSFFGALFHIDAFLFLKFFAPVLNGFLGFALFHFSSSYLGWSDRKSLFCAVLCTSYFVTLRITWDLLRNTLGLAFMFLAISHTKNLGEERGSLLFVFFSLLCLFTHELVAVLLFCVLAYLLLLELLPYLGASYALISVKNYLNSKAAFLGSRSGQVDSEDSSSEVRERGKFKTLNCSAGGGAGAGSGLGAALRPRFLVLYILILVTVVVVVLHYAGVFQTSFPTEPFLPNMKGPFVDYISWRFGLYLYPSVDALRGDIFSLFLVCFAPILPLAVLGYFRNHPLDILTLILLVGSFMPVVFPHSALPLWSRWMLILAFPFLIYTCNFLLPDGQDSLLIGRLKISRKTRRTVFVVVVPVLVLLSSAYMVLPPERAFPYFSVFSGQMYFPSSMQQNTFSLSQSPYVVLACEWLKWNMPPNSCLIVHESLYGWANLTLPLRPIYRYSYLDVGLSTALLKAEWYNSSYVLTLFPYDYLVRSGGFELVFSVGLIEVFRSVD